MCRAKAADPLAYRYKTAKAIGLVTHIMCGNDHHVTAQVEIKQIRHTLVMAALSLMASAPALRAATSTYKFVGGHFADVSGCLTTKDRVAMTLVFAEAIPEGGCNSASPESVSIGDGVNTGRGDKAYFSGRIKLCKRTHGNTIDSWLVDSNLLSKSKGELFSVYLENHRGPVDDQIGDYAGHCAPFSAGSANAAGKWTGP